MLLQRLARQVSILSERVGRIIQWAEGGIAGTFDQRDLGTGQRIGEGADMIQSPVAVNHGCRD